MRAPGEYAYICSEIYVIVMPGDVGRVRSGARARSGAKMSGRIFGAVNV